MNTTRQPPAGLMNLAEFRPSSPHPRADEPDVKSIAEAHGFRDRDPVQRKRRKGVAEPMCSFTARVSVKSANAFIEWCESERMSYREGFDRLIGFKEKA